MINILLFEASSFNRLNLRQNAFQFTFLLGPKTALHWKSKFSANRQFNLPGYFNLHGAGGYFIFLIDFKALML